MTAVSADAGRSAQVNADAAPAGPPADLEVRGRSEPRLWTRPLVELTPDTSYGFGFVEWCEERRYPLDEWEAWVAIHVGELLPDGRPRFRRVLIIVARQNGKTLLVKLLILWWAYEDSKRWVLGEEGERNIVLTSINLDYARVAWSSVAEMAGGSVTMPRGLRRLHEIRPPRLRQANGQELMTAPGGTAFKIAANKASGGGRSMSINRLVMDELREHTEWDAYNSAVHAMNAVRDAQALFISNQGGPHAVVLRGLRHAALAGTDRRLGIFEYSCPEGSRPDDLEALAYANPNLGQDHGHAIDPETLLGEARTAMLVGGKALIDFKTEVMCLDVPAEDPAINPERWRDCAGEGGLGKLRTRVAACLDVAPEGEHATLAVAAVDADGVVRVEIVRDWDSTRLLRRSLPLTVARVKPRVIGWFPAGPAAAVATALAAPRTGRRSAAWPPPGVEVKEIRTEAPAVCMGLEELVSTGSIVHPNDELLNAHISDAQRLSVGDTWVFGRRASGGPIDAAYAVAGAVHLARLLPQAPRVRKMRVVS